MSEELDCADARWALAFSRRVVQLRGVRSETGTRPGRESQHARGGPGFVARLSDARPGIDSTARALGRSVGGEHAPDGGRKAGGHLPAGGAVRRRRLSDSLDALVGAGRGMAVLQL